MTLAQHKSLITSMTMTMLTLLSRSSSQHTSTIYGTWVACRLVPANKDHPDDLPANTVPDCRPINIGNAERRLITRTYFDEALQSSYNSIIGPVQIGVVVRGGISITVVAVIAALAVFGCMQGDLRNGYNDVICEKEFFLSISRTLENWMTP